MMDILELYELPCNPTVVIICFDEKSKQLLAHKRNPLPARPGIPERYDSEYVRKGMVTLFVAVEPKAGNRHILIREQRTGRDFAIFMEWLVNQYPNVDKIVIVLDNLNTHTEKWIFETFDEEKAKEITERIEFHKTPNHGSWLNMAEIEISVLETECLNRRIPDQEILQKEVNAWMKMRNDQEARIEWRFTREKAREKFKLQTRHN
ncbi:MAG: IS630 family transposase [Candidatus Methanofastidiosia archaeon]